VTRVVAEGPGAAAFVKPQKTGASLFWKGVPREVQPLLNDRAWGAFHAECGRHGLYFTDVEPADRARNFKATAYRLVRRGAGYERFMVTEGRGAGPKEACADAVRRAAEGGFPIPAEVALILLASPVDLTALLGEPAPAVNIMELLG
jgi:hypothetical protein